MKYDLIIVGGGPAGMSAALYAARQNLKFLIITEKLGGLANLVPSLKAYLGYGYVSGFELINKFKKHLSDYKVKIKDEKVTGIVKRGNKFLVDVGKKRYDAKSLIVATGRRFRKLNVPGEEEYMNKGVSDCAVCDGPLFKNKVVAIIGGGRSGLFAALFLLKLAKKIYLIEKDRSLDTSGGLEYVANLLQKNKKVDILLSTKVIEIEGNKMASGLRLEKNKKEEVLDIEGIFVEGGYDPNTEFIENVRKNRRGEIIVDAECRTSVPGLFAAGDVTQIREKQVVVSVGEGAKAALSSVLYLEGLKSK